MHGGMSQTARRVPRILLGTAAPPTDHPHSLASYRTNEYFGSALGLRPLTYVSCTDLVEYIHKSIFSPEATALTEINGGTWCAGRHGRGGVMHGRPLVYAARPARDLYLWLPRH